MPSESQDGAGAYASVNGLKMYYEIHGTGRPLVLLHGGLSAIGTSFGRILPALAETRKVVAVEQQGHGHTADIDRPLSTSQMAADTVELLGQLGIEKADVFGYSMGSGVAMEIVRRHPQLVRKLVLAAVSYALEGFHPGILEGMQAMGPEALEGSPFVEEYVRIAPNPDDWPTLIAKMGQSGGGFEGWAPEDVQAITAPVLLIFGDSDVIRPEHAVEMFRLLGGGVAGDIVGLPRSRLAILPGTTHITLVDRGDWLVSMIEEFLDAPMPDA